MPTVPIFLLTTSTSTAWRPPSSAITLHYGAIEELITARGEHGPETLIRDNVGNLAPAP